MVCITDLWVMVVATRVEVDHDKLCMVWLLFSPIMLGRPGSLGISSGAPSSLAGIIRLFPSRPKPSMHNHTRNLLCTTKENVSKSAQPLSLRYKMPVAKNAKLDARKKVCVGEPKPAPECTK